MPVGVRSFFGDNAAVSLAADADRDTLLRRDGSPIDRSNNLQGLDMALVAEKSKCNDRLLTIVNQLVALNGALRGSAIENILIRSDLDIDDVSEFVAPTENGYGRRRVARTDEFEVLVMTWLPGQRTGAHDHAGALSVFKVLQGTARETTFSASRDSLVDSADSRELCAGQVGIDACGVIHEIRNDAAGNQSLVSLHVYAPPLPELRRFVARCAGESSLGAFDRCQPIAPTVAIIGGGFSGSMVAAQLARKSAESGRAFHVVVIDRQTAVAEGAAYRTPDGSHLLNVPATGMSAWPDRPNDFLEWSKRRDPGISPYAFLQRRSYGEYLRATFFDSIALAGSCISVEHHRQEARRVEWRCEGGWRIGLGNGSAIDADTVVLATGHRPPDDPLGRCWSGSRARYVNDPWATLALTSIEPQETVCLLGTGLTTIDVLQSLSQSARQAPVMALSRRGLMPAAHAEAPLSAINPCAWIEPMLEDGGLTMSRFAAALRSEIRQARAAGANWRQVIDGLRPYISRLWLCLSNEERGRFLRHARPFWEVSRHRMAPAVAHNVRRLTQSNLFSRAAARVVAGYGESDGVTLTIRRRGQCAVEQLKFNWVVNCTGPASGGVTSLPPVLTSLLQAGYLEADALGLGVRSTREGRAQVKGGVVEDLFIVGTLRKPDLWESTAVPELRQQAADAADGIVNRHYLPA
jgi:uncharacterized NAD(P)/FAD-binding protein YdhS/quercetin dioxygenase-like cupin family protein